MPLINGVCIPGFCLDIVFNVAGVAEQIWDKRRNRVDANKTKGLRQLGVMGPQIAAYIAKLVNVSLPCDGCNCNKKPLQGPFDVPAEDVGQPQARWQPQIAGATYTVQWGDCEPPVHRARGRKGRGGRRTAQAAGRAPRRRVARRRGRR